MAAEAFESLRVIGRGGMGMVLEARHRASGVPVAIKALVGTHARALDVVGMFLNEARAVAALHHPAIIHLHDHGRLRRTWKVPGEPTVLPEGTPWIAMELASGGTLGLRGRRMSWPALRSLAALLLDALAHAHARGVVHRDIKPENILLCTTSDHRPGVKLSDFGIAHLRGEDRSDAPLAGTPTYMAPEQFRGHTDALGPWTDLYSLGIVLQELATGTPPYTAASVPALAQLHFRGERIPVLAARPEFPATVDTWLQGLVDPEIGKRFACAADALHALAELDGETLRSPALRACLATLSEIPVGSGADDADTSPGPDPTRRSTESFQQTLGAWATSESALAATDPDGTAPVMTPLAGSSPVALDGPVPAAGALRDSDWPGWSRPPVPSTWRRAEIPGPTSDLRGVGLGLFGLRHVPLIGREHERDRIWAALNEVHGHGRPRAVVLRGPSGCGKSRLAEWVGQRAEESGAARLIKVVHDAMPGNEDGVEGALARHRELRPLFDPHDRSRLPDPAPGLSDDERGALRELLRSGDASATAAFGRVQERWHLLVRLLGELAASRPLVLWLDDIQWGPDAIGLASHILAHAEELPILLLLTVRDEALVDRPLARARLERLVSTPGCEVLALSPLRTSELGRLIHELVGLDAASSARIARRTDGNPLFAIQLIGDWVSRGVLRPGPHGFHAPDPQPIEQLPPDVHTVWRSHLDRLTEAFGGHGRGALRLAAVLGQEVQHTDWTELARRAAVPIPEGLVDHMIERRLARLQPDGWSFAHGMLREVLEDESRSGGWWKADNAVCAAMLQERYQTRRVRNLAERLGRHLLHAGRPVEASHHLLDAAALAEHRSDPDVALALLDDAEEALAAQADAHPQWSRLHSLRAAVRLLRRETRPAAEAIEAALAHANAARAVHLRADALLQRGHLRRLQSRHPDAQRDLEEALDGFIRIEDAGGRARALRSLAWAELLQARLDAAERHAREALTLFRGLGDGRGEAGALRTLGDIARNRDDHVLAETHFRDALAVFARIGNIAGVSECTHGIAECQRLRGALAEAEAGYRRTIELDLSYGCTEVTIPQINLALVQLARGEYRAPLRTMEHFLARLRGGSDAGDRGYMHFMAAVACAGLEDWAEFTHHIDLAVEALEASRHVDLDLAQYGEIGAELAETAGEPVHAERLRRLAAAQWRALGHREQADRLVR